MRLLEEAVIRTIAEFGVVGEREPGATGVWIQAPNRASATHAAKVAAMGVRLRKWVSMHGLSLNIDPDMSHFTTIVPCGLAGRPVTSMRIERGSNAPTMQEAKRVLTATLLDLVHAHEKPQGERPGV
jgi:lipoyl(octanoyl) transferase